MDARDRTARQLLELARTVARLRAEVERLPTADQIATATATLTTQIGDLAARLEAVESTRTEGQPQQQLWDWTTLEGAAAQQAMAQLRDWVEGVLDGWYHLVGWDTSLIRGQKQTSLRRIPPCWEQHSDLVIELSWLAQEWLQIYRSGQGTPAKAGDWHDRYLYGLRRRIPDTTAGPCRSQHVDPSAPAAPSAPPPGHQRPAPCPVPGLRPY